VRVWPEGHPETSCVDAYRLRFQKEGMTPQELLALLKEAQQLGIDVTGTECLYTFDGTPGFST
jgi:isocitrate dehydrogenase